MMTTDSGVFPVCSGQYLSKVVQGTSDRVIECGPADNLL